MGVCVLEAILAKISSSSRDTAALLGTPASLFQYLSHGVLLQRNWEGEEREEF